MTNLGMYGLDAATTARAVGEGMTWWHLRILADLRRIGTLEIAGERRPAYSVPGIASNVGDSAHDTERYVRQMIATGLLRECDPRWDFDALWVEIAERAS